MGGLGDLGRPPAAGGGVPVDRPAEARPAAGPELVEGLVSRILVSEPTAAGHEARLLVDPSLLPGTEIHLARGLDGFLTVSLLSSDPGSLQALVQARGDLERALDRVEGTGFKVTVGDGRGGGAEDGDRRSRGLDFTGEPE
jgi:type III secretion system needle length determinant